MIKEVCGISCHCCYLADNKRSTNNIQLKRRTAETEINWNFDDVIEQIVFCLELVLPLFFQLDKNVLLLKVVSCGNVVRIIFYGN